METTTTIKPRRSTWWSFLLYPDCAEHMLVLDWLKEHQYTYESIYILHNNDVYLEDTDEHKKGEKKKEHYHVLLHTREKLTSNSIIKFFNGYISHAEEVRSAVEYSLYMIHDTLASAHKYRYSVTDLKGNEKLIKRIRQNANSIQFSDVLSRLETVNGNFLMSVHSAILEQDEEYLDFVKKNPYLISLLLKGCN